VTIAGKERTKILTLLVADWTEQRDESLHELGRSPSSSKSLVCNQTRRENSMGTGIGGDRCERLSRGVTHNLWTNAVEEREGRNSGTGRKTVGKVREATFNSM